jgi:hypothetical protein
MNYLKVIISTTGARLHGSYYDAKQFIVKLPADGVPVASETAAREMIETMRNDGCEFSVCYNFNF